MKRSNKKGFTIVELVIVIAVIAILAAVLIPTFSAVIDKANKSAVTQEVRAALTALISEENGQLSTEHEYYFVYDGKDGAEYYLYDSVEGAVDFDNPVENAPAVDENDKVYAKNDMSAIILAGVPAKAVADLSESVEVLVSIADKDGEEPSKKYVATKYTYTVKVGDATVIPVTPVALKAANTNEITEEEKEVKVDFASYIPEGKQIAGAVAVEPAGVLDTDGVFTDASVTFTVDTAAESEVNVVITVTLEDVPSADNQQG